MGAEMLDRGPALCSHRPLRETLQATRKNGARARANKTKEPPGVASGSRPPLTLTSWPWKSKRSTRMLQAEGATLGGHKFAAQGREEKSDSTFPPNLYTRSNCLKDGKKKQKKKKGKIASRDWMKSGADLTNKIHVEQSRIKRNRCWLHAGVSAAFVRCYQQQPPWTLSISTTTTTRIILSRCKMKQDGS